MNHLREPMFNTMHINHGLLLVLRNSLLNVACLTIVALFFRTRNTGKKHIKEKVKDHVRAPVKKIKGILYSFLEHPRAVFTENTLESPLLSQSRHGLVFKGTLGLQINKNPPPIEELKDFEDDMLKMIQSVTFKQVNNPFLNKLKEDTDRIKNEPKLVIAADKTTNFYKLEPSTYNDLLEKNIAKSYKKAQPETTQAIHKENKAIATKLRIDDRVDTTADKDAFITLKDQKPNFANKPTCRLINPTKSEIGKISKNILDRINSTIAKKRNLNQWKNTTAVINWFKSIENKQQFSFICFDIEEFYPSISQDLLNKALDFASNYDNITTEERNTIIHAKNSIVIHKHIPWQKKGNTTFDVTMGSYDGAETCEEFPSLPTPGP